MDVRTAIFGNPPGRVSVERFMRLALHDPRCGYYRVRARPPGRLGDFSTAATLHHSLGWAVADWIRAQGRRAPRTIVELGGGDGSLMRTVLEALGWWGRRGRRFRIVERSTPMRKTQSSALARFCEIAWHDSIEQALAEAGGEALIFANEFVDAFPCAVLESTAPGVWREVELEIGPEGRVVEVPGSVTTSVRGVPSSALGGWPGVKPGQRIELHAAYAEWLAEWVPGWHRGAMLTIDYGATFPEVHARHPRGTLRGYLRHHRVEGPDLYQNAGHQDLTADVNFTDLIRWGEAAGLETRSLRTLRDFILGTVARRRLQTEIVERLLDPAGAGGAFLVLEQQRDA